MLAGLKKQGAGFLFEYSENQAYGTNHTLQDKNLIKLFAFETLSGEHIINYRSSRDMAWKTKLTITIFEIYYKKPHMFSVAAYFVQCFSLK